MNKKQLAVLVLVPAALVTAACGSSSSSPAHAKPTVTVTHTVIRTAAPRPAVTGTAKKK